VVSDLDRQGKPLTTLLCDGCGHVVNDPIPTAEELAAFYARDYRVSYKGATRPRGRQIARNFERIERYWRQWAQMMTNRPRMLDIGAGSGEFLFVAQALSHETQGIEPNVGYAAYCRDELGLPVSTATIEDLEKSDAVYDFIRLNHVLEHMRDPVASLERAARHLADDGVIYIEVPDILGYAAAKSRGRMFHYGHISNFSPWTLRAAAGRAGLVEVDETAPVLRNSTAGFFKKGGRWSVEQTHNRANAEQVREALRGHQERPLAPVAKAVHMARKLLRNVNHTRIAVTASAPRMIGAHYVSRIKDANNSTFSST
jgi:SAM-dependent methyltransferase